MHSAPCTPSPSPCATEMFANDSLAEAAQRAAPLLRASTRCEVLLPEQAGYSDALRLWNHSLATQPAIIVLCRSTADVQLAVRTAVSCGLPLSVHGGGFDVHGRALCAGMVLSLQHMRSATVDVASETVTFDGGCVIGDVVTAVSAHSRAIVTGTTKALGAVGWTLGGGYGQLNGRYGLGVDNVVGAQVVLADGSLVYAATADKPCDAELLWCLQGGGGGFGVVVSMTIRMHLVSEVLFGAVMFSLDEAASVLRGYQRLIYQQPDELGCMFYFTNAPDGLPVLALAPFWSGELDKGRQYVGQFEQLGTPLRGNISRMPWLSIFKPAEGGRFEPNKYATYSDCRCLTHLTDAAIDALMEAGRSLPPPHSCIVVHDLHNAATRVTPDATAYPLRQPHLNILIVSVEASSEVTDGARAWVQRLSSALEPDALSQCWPQVVPATNEGKERALRTYADNLQRLRAVKQRVDPNNLFSSSVVPL